MRAAFSKTEIESEITSRFGSAFKLHEKRPAEVISTGLCEVDSFIGGGLPRGAISEVFGPASSGRTSFMFSALAHATGERAAHNSWFGTGVIRRPSRSTGQIVGRPIVMPRRRSRFWLSFEVATQSWAPKLLRVRTLMAGGT